MSTIPQGLGTLMSESDAKVDQIQNDIIKIKLDKAVREKIKIASQLEKKDEQINE